MNARQVLALSIVAGVLGMALAYVWFARKEKEFARRTQPSPVLVAKKQIASGVRIERSLVEIRQVPEAFIQPSALANIDEAEGQISIAPMAPGEQILANKLADLGVALSLAVTPGKRAVTVSVDPAASVAGLLKPGDLVDVIVTEGGVSDKTFVFMQATLVLAVGRSFSARPVEEEASLLGTMGPDTITLEASPYQAEKLTHLERTSRVKLVLRSPGDQEKIPLPLISGPQAGRADTGDRDEIIQKR